MCGGKYVHHGAGGTEGTQRRADSRNLGDAIEAYSGDVFMKEVLGEHIYTKYLEAKEQEWRDFRAQVTDWEVSQYLYKY